MVDPWFGTDRRTPPGLLQTADRALLLLLGFEGSRSDWGVTEVAREYGFDKSVAQRLLATLAHRGFLISDPITRRYRIGPAALHLDQAWQRSDSLRMIAQPDLDELAQCSGFTALLAIPDNFHMRCVVAADGRSGPVRYYPLAGELYPAHAGATSKAYYAFLSEDERRRLFQERPMARFTDRTVTNPLDLEAQFRQVREQGYATSVGEYDREVATLAVPVFLRSKPFASISIGDTTEGLEVLAEHLPAVRRTVDMLERRLTAPPPPPARC